MIIFFHIMDTAIPPAWFSNAIAHKPATQVIKVGQKKITYLCWGDKNLPALVFLHGGFANAYWFAHLAPQLSTNFFVVALNFSGHGTSDWRESYSIEDFLSELAALLQTLSLKTVILAGFSFGARIAYLYSQQHPDVVSQLLLLDPPAVQQPISNAFLSQVSYKSVRYYAEPADILKRFRLIPKQPIRHLYICDFIAKHSIKSTPSGFTWQTDSNLFAKFTYRKSDSSTPVGELPPCTIIYGEHSVICTQAVRGEFLKHHPDARFVGIADAHHAIILDAPIFLLGCLKQVLG